MNSALRARHTKFQDLGPDVFTADVLDDMIMGTRGPLWTPQSCNEGSLCPFVQGPAGGATFEQVQAMAYAMYSDPAKPFEAFQSNMSRGAEDWQRAMGGVTPWEAFPNTSRIYWIYSGIDPWTSTGVVVNTVPEGMDLHYELGTRSSLDAEQQDGLSLRADHVCRVKGRHSL